MQKATIRQTKKRGKITEQRLIGATEAGRILNRSAESVRQYEKQEKLPAIKTARGMRLFIESDVRELAEKQCLQAEQLLG